VNLHLVILLGYAAVLVSIGLWIGRRVRASTDFFVAGRQLSPFLLFSTMLAANIGTGSTVGASGLAYRNGLSVWWWVGSAGLGSLVLAFWIGPKIRQLSERYDLRTVGDFLEHRYGPSVRLTVAVLFCIATVAILAGQFVGMARVLGAVSGVPFWTGCVVGGLVVSIYFAAGGLKTTAWVNVVQLAMIMGGFAIALPFALAAVGGWKEVVNSTQSIPGYWNFWSNQESGWFYLIMLGPAFIVSPGLLQKVYGARDDRTVRLGVSLQALALLIFAWVPVLLGMIARTAYPNLINAEQALPTLLRETLPPTLGGLGLAALFSAEVSSADAILFMLSTSLSNDLYLRVVNPNATDAQVLRVARATAVAGGGVGLLLALVFQSIISVLSFFYTVITVCLFIPVLAGLYLRRAEIPEAFGSIIGGLSALAVLQLSNNNQGIVGLTPAMIGLIAAFIGCTTVGAFRIFRKFPTRNA